MVHHGYRGTFKLCLQDVATYDFYEAAMDVSVNNKFMF
jgi:hypothetical protein